MDSPLSEVPTTPTLIRLRYLGGDFSPSDAVVPESTTIVAKDRHSLDSVPGTPVTPFRAPRSRTPSIRDSGHPPQDNRCSITPYRLARTGLDSPYVPSPSDSLVPTTPKSRLTHLTPRFKLSRCSSPAQLQAESPGISRIKSHAKMLNDIRGPDIGGIRKGHENGTKLDSENVAKSRDESEDLKYKQDDRDGETSNRRQPRFANVRRSPRLFQDSSNPNKSPDFLDLI